MTAWKAAFGIKLSSLCLLAGHLLISAGEYPWQEYGHPPKIESFMGFQRCRISISKVARPTYRYILYLYSSDIPYNPQGKILVGIQFQVRS